MIFWHSRARGEQGFVLFWRHGLRNVALPAITLQFAAFSELFGGAVLTEQVFSYPGLGQATVVLLITQVQLKKSLRENSYYLEC